MIAFLTLCYVAILGALVWLKVIAQYRHDPALDTRVDDPAVHCAFHPDAMGRADGAGAYYDLFRANYSQCGGARDRRCRRTQ